MGAPGLDLQTWESTTLTQPSRHKHEPSVPHPSRFCEGWESTTPPQPRSTQHDLGESTTHMLSVVERIVLNPVESAAGDRELRIVHETQLDVLFVSIHCAIQHELFCRRTSIREVGMPAPVARIGSRIGHNVAQSGTSTFGIRKIELTIWFKSEYRMK